MGSLTVIPLGNRAAGTLGGGGGVLIGVLLPNIVASPFTQNVLHVVLYPIKLAIQLPQLSSGSKFSEHPEQSSPVNP